MQVYVVGGAVRDRLLNIQTKDRDWVVVGGTPEAMLAKGYKPVGRDFPVFLHPETREEYALARTERKHGRGYHGFTFYASPEVSLEDDLQRRDITINAMAQDAAGKIIDPYNGQQDLKAKLIRHTSPAFVEDPLRVLRVARFAAQFHSLGFRVAAETRQLLQQMVAELPTISAERVWVETEKALSATSPQIFFEVMQQAGALEFWFPEVSRLFGIPQPAHYHPEIDCGIHTLLVLKQAALLSDEVAVRFAALTHDLGKGLTPAAVLPSHHGHEERGVAEVHRLCERLLVPKNISEQAVLCCRYHSHVHRALELRPQTVLKVFAAFDLWRRPERFANLLILAKADARGRSGYEQVDYTPGEYFAQLAAAVRQLELAKLIHGLEKTAIPAAIYQGRLNAIKEFITQHPPENFS